MLRQHVYRLEWISRFELTVPHNCSNISEVEWSWDFFYRAFGCCGTQNMPLIKDHRVMRGSLQIHVGSTQKFYFISGVFPFIWKS